MPMTRQHSDRSSSKRNTHENGIIVGENGAGKSTLMKIISGVYIPDSGVITLDNEEAAFKRPREALEKGISIIHQELNIAKDLTVAENIYLGEEIRMKGFMPFLDRKLMERLSENILEKMGVRIDVRRVSDELTASEQQIIEIAKVINRKSKIIIMDELTSSLSEAEIKVLFKIIQQLYNFVVMYSGAAFSPTSRYFDGEAIEST